MALDGKKRRMAAEINANLKHVFDRLQDDEVPERFTSLLSKLRQQDNERSSEGDA